MHLFTYKISKYLIRACNDFNSIRTNFMYCLFRMDGNIYYTLHLLYFILNRRLEINKIHLHYVS